MTAPRPEQPPPSETGASPERPLKLFIKSFGCQMNAYDASRMADVLAPEGYAETAQIEDADLVVLNTCHIRERAAEKIYSELGKIRELKAERAPDRRLTIAVAGCVAQAEGQEILRRQKAVDLVVGPQSYHRLPDLVRRARAGETAVDTEFPVESKFDHLVAPMPARTRERGVSAFVTIQEGCDKFCAFCVVPYTRGAEASRPPQAIAQEVAALVAAGVREVTLLGQNVNAYAGPGAEGGIWSLARLARHLAEIPGLARIRYTTSHPNDMAEDLDRGASRSRGLDAVPAPAGAIRFGPHPRGDEPEAHGLGLSEARRPNPDGAAGHRALVRLHRRLPGRDGGRFHRDARADRRQSASPRPSPSCIRRAPARRPRSCPGRSRPT